VTDDAELRATSDLMLKLLDELGALERRKRELPPGTEAFASLAWEVADRARLTVRWSELQLRQANEALERRANDTDGAPALVDVPARRLDVVLAEWRQAEIRLSQAHPGSPEAEEAATEATRLRIESRTLQDRKLEEQRRER
jgi:hypothetical protein